MNNDHANLRLIATDNLPMLNGDAIELENFKLLGVALAIGLLIGLERGWSARERAEGTRIAGLRTYGLLGLLGGLWAMLARQAGPVLIGFAFLAVALLLLSAYRGSLKKFGDFSITGSIASLITFSLGALSVFGHSLLAAATAVVMTALLGFKPILHEWVNRIEQEELYATLKLLLISVVILPVLPNHAYGPWEAFNPYHIWLMVVSIAAVSYLGYFAMKIVGSRHGPMLTGIFGGLVSSTVVTLNLARMGRQYPDMNNALAAGILVACATMFLRIALITSILNPRLFHLLLPALATSSSMTFLIAYWLWRRADNFPQQAEIKLKNPFQLGMALKFAALLVLVILLTRLLKFYFGDIGTYFVATVSGIADVDPIALSMAHSSNSAAEIKVASEAIALAVLANSTFKSLLTLLIGNPALGWRVGGSSLVAIAAGLLVLL